MNDSIKKLTRLRRILLYRPTWIDNSDNPDKRIKESLLFSFFIKGTLKARGRYCKNFLRNCINTGRNYKKIFSYDIFVLVLKKLDNIPMSTVVTC